MRRRLNSYEALSSQFVLQDLVQQRGGGRADSASRLAHQRQADEVVAALGDERAQAATLAAEDEDDAAPE